MYNFGRVPRATDPEWYRDGSEMGMLLGSFGAFPAGFITEVSGIPVLRIGQKSTESFGTLSLAESWTSRPRISSPTSSLGERDDRDFRLAPEAKRQGDCPDASIDIKLHSISHAEQPVHVLDSHIR
jgi:hypothetical protein